MPTKKQIKDFALVNAGYKRIEKPKKATHGDLLIDGIIKEHNLPFALLRYKKKELINSGVASKRIKITHCT